jgi:hypothetical protein
MDQVLEHVLEMWRPMTELLLQSLHEASLVTAKGKKDTAAH